jgi:hypothetical protein
MPSRADDDASVAIHLRLNRRAWERYANEAAALAKPLSTYLRERLEREDELLAELASIRRAVENLAASPPPPTTSGGDNSSHLILEVLLLCRSLAQPQRTETAHAELRRLGLEVWQPPAQPASRR